jgi:hypothetical protein
VDKPVDKSIKYWRADYLTGTPKPYLFP